MRDRIRKRGIVPLCALILLAGEQEGLAQADTTSFPAPPVEKLAALRPFLGLYVHTDSYWEGTGPWRGTLEVRPALKGWYIEFVVDTHFGPIDRQNRMILTWDDDLERYRVWRFETVPPLPPEAAEGRARFEGEVFVMEWDTPPGPWGAGGTFRNRVRMDGPDELVIVSEVDPGDGSEPVRLAEGRHQRRL